MPRADCGNAGAAAAACGYGSQPHARAPSRTTSCAPDRQNACRSACLTTLINDLVHRVLLYNGLLLAAFAENAPATSIPLTLVGTDCGPEAQCRRQLARGLRPPHRPRLEQPRQQLRAAHGA